ncbi:alpha-E domain-containing protein [Georgenia sp. Z1491]|uniref:alpha-E domain-containing protein n=1 Tax=Georgenia sp. Z1491 TaxID=3416707 RepID=UPI003CF5DE57
MLSRIAESLFWIGRYVERGDATARLLDTHLQLLLEDPWVDEDTACRGLLAIMGQSTSDEDEVARRDVLDRLAYDRTSPASIAGTIWSAREAARRARETVSSELWEVLNHTYNSQKDMALLRSAHDYFGWVRQRSAIVSGLVDSTMSRGETWSFLVLGRSLERADMTARLVATRAVTTAGAPDWTTLLRSTGAFEAFLRSTRGRAGDRQAAQFLLVDRLFPRSVVHSLDQAERCLVELRSTIGEQVAVPDEGGRILGRARSRIEYMAMNDVQENLLDEMETIQVACQSAADAVRAKFFVGEPAAWKGESA